MKSISLSLSALVIGALLLLATAAPTFAIGGATSDPDGPPQPTCDSDC